MAGAATGGVSGTPRRFASCTGMASLMTFSSRLSKSADHKGANVEAGRLRSRRDGAEAPELSPDGIGG